MLPRPYLLFYIAGGASLLSGILRLYPFPDPVRAATSFLFCITFFILAHYQRHPERSGSVKAKLLQILPLSAAVLLLLARHI